MKQQNIYRLFDANLNRVREGLRVVEDTLRFIFSNNAQAGNLKKIRHQLDKRASAIYPQLILARNVEEDENAHLPEVGRRDVAILLMANFRRAEEGLRVLEEYGKLISVSAGAGFKKLRFRVYKIEKETMSDGKHAKI